LFELCPEIRDFLIARFAVGEEWAGQCLRELGGYVGSRWLTAMVKAGKAASFEAFCSNHLSRLFAAAAGLAVEGMQ
jgi:hypothetical protein